MSSRVSLRFKFLLFFSSIILSLIAFELLLRLAGNYYLSFQRYDVGVEREGEYRILALGESTTAGTDNSWPGLLEEILNRKSETLKFRVFNEGIPGTNTAFILSRLDSNIKRYKPDMVITMMGLGDEFHQPPFRYEEKFLTRLKLALHEIRLYKIFMRYLSVFKSENSVDFSDYFQQERELKTASYYNDKNPMIPRSVEFSDLDCENLDTLKDKLAEELTEEEAYNVLGWSYNNTCVKDPEVSRRISEEAIKINPQSSRAYFNLGSSLIRLGKTNDAIEAFKKAISLDKDFQWAYFKLAGVYHDLGEKNKAFEVLSKMIDVNPDNDLARTYLAKVNQNLVQDGDEVPFYTKFFPDDVSQIAEVTYDSDEVTSYHYKLLNKKLSRKGIAYTAMQYPTRSIDSLKTIFGSDRDITFISNENFSKLVDHGEYSDYFVDRIPGTEFGHTTKLGSRLIADNVANSILNHLGIYTGF